MQDDRNVVIYRPDGTALWATTTVQWTVVPNALGLATAEAETAVRAVDLVPSFTGSGEPGAHVLRQSPRGSTRVRLGTPVTLKLSTAELVAAVIGFSRGEASEAMTSAGLVPVFTGRGFDVASQTPSAGSYVPRGTSVTLRLMQQPNV